MLTRQGSMVSLSGLDGFLGWGAEVPVQVVLGEQSFAGQGVRHG